MDACAPNTKTVLLSEVEPSISAALAEVFAYRPNQLSLADILQNSFEQCFDHVPHRAIRVTPGAGKTEYVLRTLRAWIAGRKARKEQHRVLLLVPHHELSREMLGRVQRLELSAAIFRGRTAENPENKPEKMCLDLEAVTAGLKVGAEISSQVCGRADPDKPHCPHRLSCPWWQQIDAAKEADVLIASHEFLSFGLPINEEGFGLVVVDEGFWKSGLKIPDEDNPRSFAVEGFASAVQLAPGRLDLIQMEKLFNIAQKAEATMKDAWKQEQGIAWAVNRKPEPTPLFLMNIKKAGLTLQEIDEAVRLESKRLVKPELLPGMTQTAREQSLVGSEVNVSIRLRVEFWLALRDMLNDNAEGTGWIIIEQKGERLEASILGRREVRKSLIGKPIIHLDATLQIEIVRFLLPRMKLALDLTVAAPFQTIIQVRGRSASGTREQGHWGLLSLNPARISSSAPDDWQKTEKKRRDKKLNKIRTLCLVHGAGLVTHKALLRYFKDVKLRANFNATLGLNAFEKTPSLVVLGRPLPSPEALIATARALTGKPIRMSAAIPSHIDNKLCYLNEAVSLIVRGVTEAEIIQAIGRARGVQRTADDPVVVWLFADDLDFSIDIDRIVNWEDVEPGFLMEMQATGLVLESPADIIRMFPGLVTNEDGSIISANTIRMRLTRGREGSNAHSPIHIGFIGERANDQAVSWRRVRYRPTGHGQKSRTGYVRDDRSAALRLELELALGPLAVFELDLVADS